MAINPEPRGVLTGQLWTRLLVGSAVTDCPDRILKHQLASAWPTVKVPMQLILYKLAKERKKERKEIAINFLALEYILLSISTIERKREGKLGSTSEIG